MRLRCTSDVPGWCERTSLSLDTRCGVTSSVRMLTFTGAPAPPAPAERSGTARSATISETRSSRLRPCPPAFAFFSPPAVHAGEDAPDGDLVAVGDPAVGGALEDRGDRHV